MSQSAGRKFRDALATESPLQIVGAINANHALLAKHAGFKAIYLSGGGVAAGSLGYPDLGITGLEDVLIDVRRIVDASGLSLTQQTRNRHRQTHRIEHNRQLCAFQKSKT